MQRNRLLLLAGALGAAVLIVVLALVVAGTGGGSSGTTTAAASDTTGTTTPTASLAGIPQHGDTLGRASAPVTITVFEDPQCPYCRQWNVDTLPSVVTDYVRTGRVKLVFRGINIIGPNSEKGLRAIYAAAAQNKLWQMLDAVYARQGTENSGWITDDVITQAAQAAHANAKTILGALSSAAVTAQLQNAAQEAAADAVQGTPTFVAQRPPALPQQLQITALDPASFAAALAPILQ
jgi:protein-disulfide isomerase